MKDNFFVSTTGTIKGVEIKKYIGVVDYNVAVKSDLFDKTEATLFDAFGSQTQPYQEKIDSLYQLSLQRLKVKAKSMGANAIIGLSVLLDKVSSNGLPIHMFFLSGTAVFVKSENKEIFSEEKLLEKVPNNILQAELKKRSIIQKLDNQKFLSQNDWLVLQVNPIEDHSEKVIDYFLNQYEVSVSGSSDEGKLLLKNIVNYFGAIDRDIAINILYSRLINHPLHIKEILKANKLFSPKRIIDLIEQGEINLAIFCLQLDKDFYSEKDIPKMKKIITMLDELACNENKKTVEEEKTKSSKKGKKNAKSKVKEEESKIVVFSKEEEVEHNNSVTTLQKEIINEFILKVEIIESIIKG